MRLLPVLLLAPLCLGAVRVKITETAGLARRNEAVRVMIDGKERTLFVTIAANDSRIFSENDLRPVDDLKVRPAGRIGFTVENDAFAADLSPHVYNSAEIDSGTLHALTFKSKGVTLQRTTNWMHWAPSFQRAGAKAYTSMATWRPQEAERTVAPGVLSFRRSGFHGEYPEIRLDARYRFFAHAPYFVFEARMTIEKPIDMYWLRNQEMTMDDLFTHVAWPGRDGKPVIADFEQRRPLLEKEPIPVDTPWVAFVNREKGYGYGAVILKHRATTMANPVTSINDGARNGKYWDRRLVNQVNTRLAPGDVYEEETAYVLFHADADQPLREFLDWERRLRHPVRVEVQP